MYFILKVLISALVVAGVSELARRYSIWAALLASLPLTSILAFCWVYYENRNTEQLIALSHSIFWLVLPSLLLFILFPLFLKFGFKFAPALLLSCMIMSGGYGLFIWLKKVVMG